MSEEEIFRAVREQLFTAVIGDVMDSMGLTRQFLPPEIRGLRPDMSVVGRAMPVLEADLAENDNWGDEAFGLMFRALDSLQRGEVYICTGSSPLYALWGGLMSTKAMSLGATAAVLDGYHRDTREILSLDFPVFSAGAYAQDQRLRGRVVDFRCPIEFPECMPGRRGGPDCRRRRWRAGGATRRCTGRRAGRTRQGRRGRECAPRNPAGGTHRGNLP